jgi:NADPH-dependent 2,4-dienoyl-CoA reductase/sulfur reductase-like enzyme
MENYDYLIIGGGMTSDSAVQGIRELDSHGRIGIISSEPDPPYDRPPLSKDLWKGKKDLKDIWRKTSDKGVDLYLKCTVQSVDPSNKLVYDDTGKAYHYEKLLLATGGKPLRLSGDTSGVIYFRTVETYRRLRKLADENSEFCVIGGGFIGSEIAAALTMVHRNVTMILQSSGICRHVFPDSLSQFVTSFYREKGVKILSGESLSSIEKNGNGFRIRTSGGLDLSFDAVVAGIGITPNTELALNAGLKVDNGIVVDRYLRTSNHDIFAAGDVANFESSYLDMRMRVEHEDNANTMGIRAGRNMVGENVAYDYQPFFYSDLFELGYEAVGVLDSKLQTVVDWREEFRKGVIYYLDEGRIRGVLLWNIFKQVDNARELIAQKRQYKSEDLIGLLPKPKK